MLSACNQSQGHWLWMIVTASWYDSRECIVLLCYLFKSVYDKLECFSLSVVTQDDSSSSLWAAVSVAIGFTAQMLVPGVISEWFQTEFLDI